MRSVLVFLLIVLPFCSYSQLVNIESKRMQTDSTRYVFRADLSSSYTNNNGDYLYLINSNLTAQVKSKDLNNILFLIGDYGLITSENIEFQNAWFLHLRYNQELTELFRFEAFIQSQENKILDINRRNLIGAGIRLKLLSKEHLRLYWGNAYMYEYERTNDLDVEVYNHRYSTYLSLSMSNKSNTLNLTNTCYYQPLLRDFGDTRILDQLKMNFQLTKKLSFFTLFEYFNDSITLKDRSQYSINTSFGIGLNL